MTGSAGERRLWEALRDGLRDGVRHGMIASPTKRLALRERVAGCCRVPRLDRGPDPMPSPCGDDMLREVGPGGDPERFYCWCGHTAGCHARRAGCAVHGGGEA